MVCTNTTQHNENDIHFVLPDRHGVITPSTHNTHSFFSCGLDTIIKHILCPPCPQQYLAEMIFVGGLSKDSIKESVEYEMNQTSSKILNSKAIS